MEADTGASVFSEARKAKANGSTRFCMGAAWRDLSGRKRGFERILEMVKGVRLVMPLRIPWQRAFEQLALIAIHFGPLLEHSTWKSARL